MPTTAVSYTMFKHARIDAAHYGNLETAKDAAAFMCMVDDYMSYLRSGGGQVDTDDSELQYIGKFVDMIDHDRAWALAQHMAPEFKSVKSTTAELPRLIRLILAAIHHRLPLPQEHSASRDDLKYLYQEEKQWQKLEKQVELIAFANRGGTLITKDRREQVDKVLEDLKVVAVTKAHSS